MLMVCLEKKMSDLRRVLYRSFIFEKPLRLPNVFDKTKLTFHGLITKMDKVLLKKIRRPIKNT